MKGIQNVSKMFTFLIQYLIKLSATDLWGGKWAKISLKGKIVDHPLKLTAIKT